MDLQTLYETEFDFVWRSLRRLGVPESDLSDAIQEVFMTAHRKLPEFEGRAKFSTWLFQIAFGVASTRKRRAYRRHEVIDWSLLEECCSDEISPEDSLFFRESVALLDRALDELSLEQRSVFILFELEEVPCEEIAATLGIPVGTVYSRLRLGRAAFQRALRQLRGQTTRINRIAAGSSS
ncbi:MAG TPA: sigma-70 family RNA polymerase sigma factor [Polyangiaceae bacterium]|nr:sigma-70 family RNA polymerase sigma factor [Polyangiaceae bacterium]